MFDYLCISKPARRMLEKAMVDIAQKLGGPKAFFADSPPQLDFVTDLDLLEFDKIPTLAPNDHTAKGRTSASWPQQDETLSFTTGVITIFDQYLCHPQPDHNRPIYVSVIHSDKLIRRALVDIGTSINILPLSVLFELGYSEADLCPDSTPVASFKDDKTGPLGTISFYIVIGPLKMCHVFHVMKIEPVFHMLLGRPWLHDHRCVSSTWHQCTKLVPHEGKQIRIRASREPFMPQESHCLTAAFFLNKDQLKSNSYPPREPPTVVIRLPPALCAANVPLKKLPVISKSHPLGVVRVASILGDDAALVPFSITISPPCPGLPKPRLARSWREEQQIEDDDFKAVIAAITLPTAANRAKDICKSPYVARIPRSSPAV